MSRDSCVNCANANHIGKVIRCNVLGVVKTQPYTKCGNWEKARVQSKLMEEDE